MISHKEISQSKDQWRKAIIQRMEQKGEREEILDSERVKSIRTRRMQNEMFLAKAREELILKTLVEKQAAFLIVALRQKILSIPHTYARRILNLTDSKAAAAILKEMAVSVLNEIKDLPQKVVDPQWLDTIEKDAEQS